MADKKYQPPEQSGGMQFFDIVLLLLLIFGTMLVPATLQLAGAATNLTKIDNPTWDTLKQTPGQAAAWTALGRDPASAHDIIQTSFDYTINWPTLLLVAGLLFLYFFLLFRLSDIEYRDVIAEKFGTKK